MCGICGVLSTEGVLDPQVREALPRMTSTLAHRGPDGEDFYFDNRIGLGHRRLSIIDIAGGTQPMSNEDGTVWTVFNGEIYNHKDLRNELLAKGHRFRTECDTEVLVHAFEEYGSGCVERLAGMFAFAVYDQKTGHLLLARDRLGKKPLFYARFGDSLHFASEIKALKESPLWDGDWSSEVLEEYLALGYIIAPRTIYRHVNKLEAGSFLFFRNGDIQVERYWDVDQFDSDGRSEPELLDELQLLLGEAVGSRLESEVPLGAFLSGGIDSGLVVSYMSEMGNSTPTTCSVGFSDTAHNELEAASRVAAKFRTSHHSHILTEDLSSAINKVVTAFDEPFADSSAFPTFFLCKIARQHATVCLSGDGGDETFGGYDFRYTPHALEARLRGLVPGDSARKALRWLGNNWSRSRRLPRHLRLGTYLTNLGWDDSTAYFLDLCFLKPRDVAALVGGDTLADPRDSSVYARVTEPYLRCPSKSPLQRAQYADLQIYLPNDVLVKVDRMSMQHSLEVRAPLLDHRITEYAFRIPTTSKLPRLQPKHLLREIGRRRLPQENIELPKQGFTAPVGAWFSGFLGDRFNDEALGPTAKLNGLVDVERARFWLQEHRSGRADRSYALWALWCLEMWARNKN